MGEAAGFPQLLVQRAPSISLDPSLVLRGYRGRGEFPAQQVWDISVPFDVQGWSLGHHFCYEISWRGGDQGLSTMRLDVPLPSDPVCECASITNGNLVDLSGQFINHQQNLSSF